MSTTTREGTTGRAAVVSRALRLAFVLYLCVVGFGVFGPSPGDQLEQAGEELRKVEQEVRSIAPGDTADTPNGHLEADEWIFGDLDAEAVGNVAMFLPLGVLLPLLWPRWWMLSVPVGVALSGFIEVVQLLFLSWRSPSAGDVGWNSLGAVIGFGLWLPGSWCWRRLQGSSAHSRHGVDGTGCPADVPTA